MKKLILTISALSMMLCLNLASCSDDDDKDEDKAPEKEQVDKDNQNSDDKKDEGSNDKTDQGNGNNQNNDNQDNGQNNDQKEPVSENVAQAQKDADAAFSDFLNLAAGSASGDVAAPLLTLGPVLNKYSESNEEYKQAFADALAEKTGVPADEMKKELDSYAEAYQNLGNNGGNNEESNSPVDENSSAVEDIQTVLAIIEDAESGNYMSVVAQLGAIQEMSKKYNSDPNYKKIADDIIDARGGENAELIKQALANPASLLNLFGGK